MKKSRLPYQEGDWFLVPLEKGLFALGIVARSNGNKGGIFSYFFDPNPVANPLALPKATFEKRPSDAIEVIKFGYLGLITGDWFVVHRPEHWDRQAWPVPTFSQVSTKLNNYHKVHYDDADPFHKTVAITRVRPEELEGLPSNSFAGHVYIERRLNALLTKAHPDAKETRAFSLNKDKLPVEHSSQPVTDDETSSEHTLLVSLKLSDDDFGDGDEVGGIFDLGDRFHERFAGRDDIEFDGDEVGEGYATLYFYGKDADAMLAEVSPILRDFAIPPGSMETRTYLRKSESCLSQTGRTEAWSFGSSPSMSECNTAFTSYCVEQTFESASIYARGCNQDCKSSAANAERNGANQ